MGRLWWSNIFLYIFAIVVYGSLTITVAIFLYTTYLEGATQVASQLIAGECFSKRDRERWEPVVEGQIVEVGVKQYLVLFGYDLKRNRYQLQYASSIPIPEFDQTFQRVICPKRWS